MRFKWKQAGPSATNQAKREQRDDEGTGRIVEKQLKHQKVDGLISLQKQNFGEKTERIEDYSIQQSEPAQK